MNPLQVTGRRSLNCLPQSRGAAEGEQIKRLNNHRDTEDTKKWQELCSCPKERKRAAGKPAFSGGMQAASGHFFKQHSR